MAADPIIIGLIADTQYADEDDGTSFDGKELRHYRDAVAVTCRAADAFKALSVASVVHLGDIVDGRHPRKLSVEAFDRITAPLAALGVPLHFVPGNHDFYSFGGRARVANVLGFPTSVLDRVLPSPAGWRLLSLDCYGVSRLGVADDAPEAAQAAALLDAHNPNADKNSPSGLVGIERRWVAFNGAVGPSSLAWLESNLQAARAAGEWVIVFSHVPLHPDCGAPLCTVWNYAEVLAVLRAYRDVFVAAFHGHDHQGGYASLDGDGALPVFICLKAALTCEPGDCAHAALALSADRLEVLSVGATEPRSFALARP